MKKLAIGAGVLVVVLAALPPVLGAVGESAVRAGIRQMEPNPFVSVELEAYDRGAYTSDATFILNYSPEYWDTLRSSLQGPDAGDEAESPEARAQRESMLRIIDSLAQGIRVDARIVHGPVYFQGGPGVGWSSAHFEVQPNSADMRETLQSLNMPYLMAADSRVGLGGQTVFDATVPPFTIDDDFTLEFTGLDMAGAYTPLTQSIVYAGTISRISGDNAMFEADVLDVRLEADMNILTSMLWVGDSDITIDRMVLTSRENLLAEPLQVRDFGIRATTGLDDSDGTGFLGFAYRVGEVSGVEGAALSDLEFSLAFRHLDVDALSQYYDVVQDMTLQGLPDEAAGQALTDDMASAIDALLAGSPEFRLDPVAFRLNDDRLFSRLALRIEGDKAVPLAQLDSAPPEAVLDMLDVNVDLEVTEPLAQTITATLMADQLRNSVPPDSEITEEDIQQAAQAQSSIMLVGLVQQGLLTIDEDTRTLSLQAHYSNGELTVNDQPVPLDNVLGQPSAP